MVFSERKQNKHNMSKIKCSHVFFQSWVKICQTRNKTLRSIIPTQERLGKWRRHHATDQIRKLKGRWRVSVQWRHSLLKTMYFWSHGFICTVGKFEGLCNVLAVPDNAVSDSARLSNQIFRADKAGFCTHDTAGPFSGYIQLVAAVACRCCG